MCVGGTCVNRGCVPSKALLAVSGRMRELHNQHHLNSFGLQVSAAGYDRHGVADHASNLATKIRNNLTNSMKALVRFALEYDQVVTFIEALDQLMPGFDPEINFYLSFNSSIQGTKGYFGGETRLLSLREELHSPKWSWSGLWKTNNLDRSVFPQRGFIPVDERMRVIDGNGKLVPHLYCIGDANGKLMLAHAASAQGISVVEQVTGRDHVLNHLSIPAACFTHPEISMVGLTEPQAREKAEKEGFKVSIAKDKFQGEHKGPTALAENEGEGLAKMIYRPDNGEILGVHIFGLHAADLIHEASNAIALGTRIQPDFSGFILMMVQDIKLAVHAHPTLSEVVDELFKAAKVESPASTTAQSVKAAV
ncbi:hypothetical protein DY000_02026641 [Brassica cretica]|uniref:Pyridine nucleotide-disulphide oxidoreductase dimerisation domain-containing protein n=1 Tax=Brassica cretica TaxID=69181 RepID=A0ABQ7EM02_BRACR|nr:hypothetical protein DY000_02026641 [Brassica cretica]